ncbi:TolC family protein [Paludisphaera mucosa]|uniref:TolC family protein n=1 Tax=Paludisphaera mucosa TaxID=3030827 RepID=A0ABT6F674_9BACT|nr:TolC family protein [Paludisphaera mucosa]MDG3002923.1 TolC family protein [Paludisphaera mucosa]
MRGSRMAVALALCWWQAAAGSVRGEDLHEAWAIALGGNQGLQARQEQTAAAGFSAAAARSDRLPSVRSLSFNAFLTATPTYRPFQSSGGQGGSGSSSLAGLPTSFPILGNGQRNLPFSLTYANIPLYTGGRLKNAVAAADARTRVERAQEYATALDLKMGVARTYIGVLRARRSLEVAESNVDRLQAFARDVRNRRREGMAVRSDVLAAEVSLANAQLGRIQGRTSLDAAWSAYNRLLCRPLSFTTDLVELGNLPQDVNRDELAAYAEDVVSHPPIVDESEVADLTARAFEMRPELAGLTDLARGFRAQAAAARGATKPQVGFAMAFLYLGNNSQAPQGIGAATFYFDWLMTDSGGTRRRTEALRRQEVAALKRKADEAADVALEVRTRWLDRNQARLRIPVSRLAIAQAEENLNVLIERYRQEESTYTEVLDAENRRVASLNNYYNAVYDETQADFALRRAVGTL